jgi:hypothetical protein
MACNRSSQQDNSNDSFDDKIREAVIQAAVSELIRLEDSNNGRLPHKAMQNIIDGIKKRGYVVGRGLLNHQKRIARERLKPTSSVEFTIADDNINISHGSDIIYLYQYCNEAKRSASWIINFIQNGYYRKESRMYK